MPKSKDLSEKPVLPDWKSIGIGIVVGMIFMTIIVALGGRLEKFNLFGAEVVFPTPNSTNVFAYPESPSVSLVGISFMTGGWNPRMLDLRTASTEGISVEPDNSLKLFDIQVVASDNMPDGYQVQAEVYANDNELIGKTNMVELGAGEVSKLGDIIPTSYKYDDDKWRTQIDWSGLSVLLKVYEKNGKDAVWFTKTYIKFTNSSSQSWLNSPPYASFVSIVYQINDEEKTQLDFRKIDTDGIRVKPGDHFRIWEIWYHTANDDSANTLSVDIYISTINNYNTDTAFGTDKQIFLSGVHNLMTAQPWEWEIKPEYKSLILTLLKHNGVYYPSILDRYGIPFNIDV